MIALARTGIPTRAALLLKLTLSSNSARPRGGNPNPRPTVVLSLPSLRPAPRWGLLLRVPPTLYKYAKEHNKMSWITRANN